MVTHGVCGCSWCHLQPPLCRTGLSEDEAPEFHSCDIQIPQGWQRGAHSLPETGLRSAWDGNFHHPLHAPVCSPWVSVPAFRALICRPVIWTNVDGQKQAGLSSPPLPFSLFFHLPHSPLPVRTSREKDEQLTHKINTGLTVSDRD